jgi:zinc protease
MQLYKKVFCALAAVSLFGLQAKAQKVEFTEYDLPNGLHVILHNDSKAPVVAVTVMYHVGSKNEAVGRTLTI